MQTQELKSYRKNFLVENSVPFQWLDIEIHQGEDHLLALYIYSTSFDTIAHLPLVLVPELPDL
ncbi:MAG TPA: hypothetical protein VFY41_01810 [Nitrososphaeraceae archaeon]|nr:hypothetical protein [Nitrososphaeraceae archaeon]